GFFGDGLRAIVLDEAHLYTGTLAAEITLLLRRLVERCGVPAERLLHIATSATIGREGDAGDEELRQFASTLFSKTSDLIEVIRGKANRIEMAAPSPPSADPTCGQIARQSWVTKPTLTMDREGNPALATDAELSQRLGEQLPALVDDVVVKQGRREDMN